MKAIEFIRLPADEKLILLRRLDHHREWESLDDRRLCLECGKSITGRQIQVSGGRDAFHPFQLHCPTEGCASVPMDWSRPASNFVEEDDSEQTGPEGGVKGAEAEADEIAHRILWRAY